MSEIVNSKIMKCYSKMRKCREKGHIKLSMIYQKLIRFLFSAEIPYTVELGDNVDLVHGGLGVVIHKDAKIGANTKIYQNVTIGGLPDGGVPVIGQNVLIGSGAVILGGINIGDNAKIGANAVVLIDIPPNSTAVGVPAKILKKD